MACGTMINFQQQTFEKKKTTVDPEEENALERFDSFLFLSLGIRPNSDLEENLQKPLDLKSGVRIIDKKFTEENVDLNPLLPPCALIPPFDGFTSTSPVPSELSSVSGTESPKEIVTDDDRFRAAHCFLLEEPSAIETEAALLPDLKPLPASSYILNLVNSLSTSPISTFEEQHAVSDYQSNASEAKKTEVVKDQRVPENENGSPKNTDKRKKPSLLASKKKKRKLEDTYLAPKKEGQAAAAAAADDDGEDGSNEFLKPTTWLYCEYCFDKIANKSLLMLHMRKHRDPDYRCGKCGEEIRGDRKKDRDGRRGERKDEKKRDLVAKRSHELRCYKKNRMIQRYYMMKSSKNGIIDPFDCEVILDKSNEY